MCVCPFHDDKNPSMKVDRRFHCFGCQADGDVIDFVSRLENVSPKEAALMLAQDFSVPYEDREPPGRSRRPQAPAGNPGAAIQAHGAILFPGTVRLSQSAAPLESGSMPPRRRTRNGTRFSWKPCRRQSHVEYLLDVLLFSDMEERAALIASYGKEVRNLERRMADLAARTAGRP